MKGIVFVKLGEFVEATWNCEFWDELICDSKASSYGIYTSAAMYDDQELYDLIALISAKKATPVFEVQKAFGRWVFKSLYASAPPGVHHFSDVFQFLRTVQDVVHVEVKKINQDALLPSFDFLSETESSISFHYQSPRQLCHFCEGLIYGLAELAEQSVTVLHQSCEHVGDEKCILQVIKESF